MFFFSLIKYLIRETLSFKLNTYRPIMLVKRIFILPKKLIPKIIDNQPFTAIPFDNENKIFINKIKEAIKPIEPIYIKSFSGQLLKPIIC